MPTLPILSSSLWLSLFRFHHTWSCSLASTFQHRYLHRGCFYCGILFGSIPSERMFALVPSSCSLEMTDSAAISLTNLENLRCRLLDVSTAGSWWGYRSMAEKDLTRPWTLSSSWPSEHQRPWRSLSLGLCSWAASRCLSLRGPRLRSRWWYPGLESLIVHRLWCRAAPAAAHWTRASCRGRATLTFGFSTATASALPGRSYSSPWAALLILDHSLWASEVLWGSKWLTSSSSVESYLPRRFDPPMLHAWSNVPSCKSQTWLCSPVLDLRPHQDRETWWTASTIMNLSILEAPASALIYAHAIFPCAFWCPAYHSSWWSSQRTCSYSWTQINGLYISCPGAAMSCHFVSLLESLCHSWLWCNH